MLRIHFTDADLARTRVVDAPDPLWEVAMSLHRFQTRRGRWAYAEWHRITRVHLHEKGLDQIMRTVLLPLFPRAAYFPDFLTPQAGADGLEPGLEAIRATPPQRVLHELALLERRVGAPAWTPGLADLATRDAFLQLIRDYYEVAIAPHGDRLQARIEADRSARCRDLLDGGVEGMLAGLRPTMRWCRPVLYVNYPVEERDLHLDGRGLVLVPSYFCWHDPVSLADPALPPVLIYPLLHEPPASSTRPDGSPAPPLTALLGNARAIALWAAASGATTGEIARAAGVSPSSASRHATALRDAGLITSKRHGAFVLHTLTVAGASVLRASGCRPASGSRPGGAPSDG